MQSETLAAYDDRHGHLRGVACLTLPLVQTYPDVRSEKLAVAGSCRLDTVLVATVIPISLVDLQDADVRSEKLAVEDRIKLSCAASWVQHPATLFLPHNGRGFEVRVDPTQLPEGMSYTEVLGWDSTAAWRGPLFRQA